MVLGKACCDPLRDHNTKNKGAIMKKGELIPSVGSPNRRKVIVTAQVYNHTHVLMANAVWRDSEVKVRHRIKAEYEERNCYDTR